MATRAVPLEGCQLPVAELPLYLPTWGNKKAKTLLTCDHFYFTSWLVFCAASARAKHVPRRQMKRKGVGMGMGMGLRQRVGMGMGLQTFAGRQRGGNNRHEAEEQQQEQHGSRGNWKSVRESERERERGSDLIPGIFKCFLGIYTWNREGEHILLPSSCSPLHLPFDLPIATCPAVFGSFQRWPVAAAAPATGPRCLPCLRSSSWRSTRWVSLS